MNINPPRPCPEGREIKGGQNPSNTSDWRLPRPGGSQPQAETSPASAGSDESIDLEVANRLLKEVYEVGCKRGDGAGKCEDCCRYCGCCVTHRASNDETHEPDCLWPVIEGFLKDQGVL